MKRVFFVLISLYLLYPACSVIDKLTQFNMDYDMSVVIPSSTLINLPINISTPEIESNSESTFSVNDTRKEMIEEIVLRQLKLTLTDPPEEDFSFLESLSIYISAEGLSETEIAWMDPVPADANNVLDLETSDADLKEYIKKDRFSLRLNTVTDEALTVDHHIDIHATFFVDAKILGQ